MTIEETMRRYDEAILDIYGDLMRDELSAEARKTLSENLELFTTGRDAIRFKQKTKTWMEHSGCATHAIERKYIGMTNAEKIRSMSDEELAEWILQLVDCGKENVMCNPTEYKLSGKCNGRCLQGRLDWLRQPAEEGNDNGQ